MMNQKREDMRILSRKDTPFSAARSESSDKDPYPFSGANRYMVSVHMKIVSNSKNLTADNNYEQCSPKPS